MQIEQFTANHRAAFEDMFVDYFVNDFGAPMTPDVIREQICPKLITSSERGISPLLIALQDDKPIAFVSFQVDSEQSDWNDKPGWGFIRECYVRPELRGHGVGRILSDIACASLREAGATDAYLTTEDAFDFWEKAGWTRTGETAPNGGEVLTRSL